MAEELGVWRGGGPGVPEEIQKVIDQIQKLRDVIQLFIAILDIVLAVLDVVKAFLVGLLDPLVPLLEAIIDEIQAFLNDLRQIGVYLHGDYGLVTPDMEKFLGGFQGYKRRMLARLLDRRDPNRPNFSPQASAVAIFFYISADITGLRAIIALLELLKRLFNLDTGSANNLPLAANLKAAYGLDGASLSTFGALLDDIDFGLDEDEDPEASDQEGLESDPFNLVNLSWNLAPAAGSTGAISLPRPPPDGFLIEVSTVRDGLTLQWDRPLPNNTGAEGEGETVQARDRGLFVDERRKPFRIFGGFDQLDVPAQFDYNDNISGGKIKNGAVRAFAVKSSADPGPVPISLLKQGSQYVFQRTFFLQTGTALQYFSGNRFNTTLDFDDMPFDATIEVGGDGAVTVTPTEQPSTFFVRVAAVKDPAGDFEEPALTGPSDFQYALTTARAFKPGEPIMLEPTVFVEGSPEAHPDVKGKLSAPLEITFPLNQTKKYLETVASALAVMVLSRSDLKQKLVEEDDPIRNLSKGNPVPFSSENPEVATGIEEIADKLFKLVIENSTDFFAKDNASPISFRNSLKEKVLDAANELIRKTGPNQVVEDLVLDAGEILRKWRWTDSAVEGSDKWPNFTLLQSLADSDPSQGIGLNLYSIGAMSSVVVRRLSDGDAGNFFAGRPPFFYLQPSPSLAHSLATDFSPVIYGQGGSSFATNLQNTRVAFVRNAFPPEVYGAAFTVLNLAAGPELKPSTDIGWISQRLFPELFTSIDDLADQILDWARAFVDGLRSISEAIVRFIEGIQMRILELRDLLRRIDALLALFTNIQFPTVDTLVVVGDGTDGLVRELVTAEEEPQDSLTSYGGGAVMVAGGLPTILLDFLTELIQQE